MKYDPMAIIGPASTSDLEMAKREPPVRVQQAGSVIICPHCGKPDGVYLHDVPVYERWSNADSQRMHRKYGCKSCDKTWVERISPNDKDQP